MEEVSLAKFIELYEKGLLFECIRVRDRIYARTPWKVEGTFKTVYAVIP